MNKQFFLQRYRDRLAVGTIFMYVSTKWNNKWARKLDDDFVMARLYTHDESSIEFREKSNMPDHAVRRTKMIDFANGIRA